MDDVPGFDKALTALALVFLLTYQVDLVKNPGTRGLIGEKATKPP